MQKVIDFGHCTRHKLVREIEEFNYSDSSELRVESSTGMLFMGGDNTLRPFLPFYNITNSAEDVEIYVRLKVLSLQSTNFVNNGGGLVMCSDSSLGASANSNVFVFGTSNSDANTNQYTSFLRENVASTGTTKTSIALPDKPIYGRLSTIRNMKFKKTGLNYQVKTWWDGTSEPAYSGDFTFTRNTGYCGIELGARLTNVFIEFASIGTNGDAAPMTRPANRIISGTLLKPDDSVAAEQTVRLYHQFTGALLGRLITDANGMYEFSLPISETELVQIVGVDSLGNEWKPPIHETYPIL